MQFLLRLQLFRAITVSIYVSVIYILQRNKYITAMQRSKYPLVNLQKAMENHHF